MKINRFKTIAGATALTAGYLMSGNAHAQSSVQLYGLIGTYIGSVKHSGATPANVEEAGGGLTTSYWGMRGTEDLGGGNHAIFTLESFFQPNTGAQGRTPADPFWSRNAYVGLSNDHYGQLTFGLQTNPTYLNMQLLNPFVASVVFSPIVVQSFVSTFNGTIIGDTVWTNTAEYTSPNIHGLTVTAIYGFGGIAGQTGVANMGLHASYIKGPFTAAFSAQRVRETPITVAQGEQITYLGGATYDFRLFKLYGAAESTNTYGTHIGTHTYELGLRVPVTIKSAILAEWARTNRGAPKQIDSQRNTVSVSYDYTLSRRTDVYAVYMYDKTSGFGSASTETVAIRHSF